MSNLGPLSERASELKPSLTLEISSLAKSLKSQGKDICSMSAGEPDFETPDFIVEATKKALADGITKYGPAGGDPELRQAIATKLTEVNKVASEIENIQITNGGKQAIFNLLQVVIQPRDEVLIPSPYWLSYPEMTKFAGGVPVEIKSSPKDGFAIDINKIEEKITERTRLIILNSPCNPTGRVMNMDELGDIADLLRRHPNILLLSDEIYEFLIAEDQVHISLKSLAPDLKDRIFIVNGFAKAWAMTGWRVGYLQGNKEVIKKTIALQSQSTSNVCSFVQRGALEAILKAPRGIEYMIESYNKRRKLLNEKINGIKRLSLVSQKGAFYAFPSLHPDLPRSLEFCKLALEMEGLAIVPGIAFGDDSCFRLSCSVSEETINDGVYRLDKLISKLIE